LRGALLKNGRIFRLSPRDGVVYHRHCLKTHVLPKTKMLASTVMVVLLGLALYLPGVRSLPVTDRDEARYAQASRQMVESGDYIRIRFLDEARNKKPIGIYWLQAASVRLTGVKDAIWPYRLVSVFGSLLSLVFMYALARRLKIVSPLLPVVAFATAPLSVIVAHAATTDAMLLAATCGAQFCLGWIYLGSEEGNRTRMRVAALGFWIALGIGILVKGPLIFIAPLTAVALCAHDRKARWLLNLYPWWGIPLMLAIVLPWFIAIQRATQGVFLREALGHDFARKLQTVQESHGACPGSYWLMATFYFWPLFPLAWRGLGQAWRNRRSSPAIRLLLAWLVPAWLVFEVVPTKLPHYMLPLYPVLAFLAMSVRPETVTSPAKTFWDVVWRVSCHVIDALWWVVAVFLVVSPPVIVWLLGGASWLATAGCSVLAFMITVWCFFARRDQKNRHVVTGAVVFSLLYVGLLFGSVLPRLGEVWLTRRVAALVATQTHGKPAHLVSVGYNEPSLAFAVNTQRDFWQNATNAVAIIQQDSNTLALVQDAPVAPIPANTSLFNGLREHLLKTLAARSNHCERAEFLFAVGQAGLSLRELGSVEGINYSRFERVRITLFARADESP